MDANHVGEKSRSKENHHGDSHEEDGRSSFDYVYSVMRFKAWHSERKQTGSGLLSKPFQRQSNGKKKKYSPSNRSKEDIESHQARTSVYKRNAQCKQRPSNWSIHQPLSGKLKWHTPISFPTPADNTTIPTVVSKSFSSVNILQRTGKAVIE